MANSARRRGRLGSHARGKPPGRTMAHLQFGEVLQGTPLLPDQKAEDMVRRAGFEEVSWLHVHPLLHAMIARKQAGTQIPKEP